MEKFYVYSNRSQTRRHPLAALEADVSDAKPVQSAAPNEDLFTAVDLKEFKIRVWTAYRLITFYRRVEAQRQADLFQNTKDQERSPIMALEEEDRNRADL